MFQSSICCLKARSCAYHNVPCENLIRERQCDGLSGHFGIDKMIALFSESYYWTGMSVEVKKMVEGCKICKHAKGVKKNT